MKIHGLDNIPAIIWKTQLFQVLLLKFSNQTKCGTKPEALNYLLGPTTSEPVPSNYQGIKLSAIASNTFNTVLLKRLIGYVNPVLKWFQKRQIYHSRNPWANKDNQRNENVQKTSNHCTIVFANFQRLLIASTIKSSFISCQTIVFFMRSFTQSP